MARNAVWLVAIVVLFGLAGVPPVLAGPGDQPTGRGTAGTPDAGPKPTGRTGNTGGLDFAGRWEGTYVCGQGVTGLTLRVVDESNGNVDQVSAVFSFHAVAENPSVPSGEFTMSGQVDRARQRLALRAGQWVDQPPNYVTVDLDGTGAVSATGTMVLTGSVIGPGCSSFSLTRTDPPPSAHP